MARRARRPGSASILAGKDQGVEVVGIDKARGVKVGRAEDGQAAMRLRTEKSKGSGSRAACLAMVFKLAESAGRSWRRLNGSEYIRDVIAGVVFVDGIRPERLAE
ncbi:MAG: hypothetical protein KF787_08235 [Phycisphaeraceae bacterium]|nr:hypothetical protein [Phycisphaeraceae bacterium]